MQKKKLMGVFVFLILMINLFTFVSAQSENVVAEFIDGFARAVEPIAKAILGGVEGTSSAYSVGEILFAKIMLFFILLMVTNLAIKNFPGIGDKGGIVFIISLIISVLSIRFIFSANVIQAIWLPYGVIGVALTSILPFIVFFLFVEGFDSSLIRKVGWVSFLVIFVALASLRWEDLKLKSGAFGGYSLAWIYLIIAILSGLLLIFDRKIRGMIRMASIGKITDRTKRVQAGKIVNELEDLYGELARTTDPKIRDAVENTIKAKEDALRALHK